MIEIQVEFQKDAPMFATTARIVPVAANIAHPIAIVISCCFARSLPIGLFDVTMRIATAITAHTAAAIPQVRATFWSAPKKPTMERVALPKVPPIGSPPSSCPDSE